MAHKHKKTHTFNTLRFAKKLKSAGFTQQQAEMQTEALSEVIHDQLVTKTDIELLRCDMKLWFGTMMVSSVMFLSALMTVLSFIHH